MYKQTLKTLALNRIKEGELAQIVTAMFVKTTCMRTKER